MTNKEKFLEAHKMTRNIVKAFGVNYKTQFSICLKYVWSENMSDEKSIEERLEDALNSEAVDYEKYYDYVSAKCNYWSNYGKERTYYQLNCYRKGKLKKTIRHGYFDHQTNKYVYDKLSKNLLTNYEN